MSQDRHFRAHGRRRVDLAATLRRPSKTSNEAIRVVDLCLAGACIELDEPLPIGAKVRLEIVAPTLWDPLVLRSQAVWSVTDPSARAGLSFTHDDQSLVFALFELMGAHGYEV